MKYKIFKKYAPLLLYYIIVLLLLFATTVFMTILIYYNFNIPPLGPIPYYYVKLFAGLAFWASLVFLAISTPLEIRNLSIEKDTTTC